MGLWNEVGDPEQKANDGGGTGYFYPGEYLVTIDCTKHRTKANGARKETFVIEARPLAVASDDARAPKAGEKRSQVISGFGGEWHELAIGDVKAFMNAVFGGATAQWTMEQWEAAGAKIDGEGIKGFPMHLECWMNKAGKFTIHKWRRPTAEDFARFGVALPQPPQAA